MVESRDNVVQTQGGSASPHPHRMFKWIEIESFQRHIQFIPHRGHALFCLRSYLPLFNLGVCRQLLVIHRRAVPAATAACWSIIPGPHPVHHLRFLSHELALAAVSGDGPVISLLFYSKKRTIGRYLWPIYGFAGLVIMGILMKGGILGLDSGGERSVGRFASDPHALRLRMFAGESARDIPGPGTQIQDAGDKDPLHSLYRDDTRAFR